MAGENPRWGYLGLPGWAASAGPPRRRLGDPSHPPAAPDPTGTGPAHRHQLAALPAHAGHRHAGGRLLLRRLRAHPAAAVCPRSGRVEPGASRSPPMSGCVVGVETLTPTSVCGTGTYRRCAAPAPRQWTH